jgi:hypothetical protein
MFQFAIVALPQGYTVVQHFFNGGSLHKVECRHMWYNGYGLAIFVTR